MVASLTLTPKYSQLSRRDVLLGHLISRLRVQLRSGSWTLCRSQGFLGIDNSNMGHSAHLKYAVRQMNVLFGPLMLKNMGFLTDSYDSRAFCRLVPDGKKR